MITAYCDVLRERVHFVDRVSTGQQNESDVRGGTWLLYLKIINMATSMSSAIKKNYESRGYFSAYGYYYKIDFFYVADVVA